MRSGGGQWDRQALTQVQTIETGNGKLIRQVDADRHAMKNPSDRHVVIREIDKVWSGFRSLQKLRKPPSPQRDRGWLVKRDAARQLQSDLGQSRAETIKTRAGAAVAGDVMANIGKATVTSRDQVPRHRKTRAVMGHADSHINRISVDIHDLDDRKASS